MKGSEMKVKSLTTALMICGAILSSSSLFADEAPAKPQAPQPPQAPQGG